MTETELKVRIPGETMELLEREFPGKTLKDYETWILKWLKGMVRTREELETDTRITVRCPRCSRQFEARNKGYTPCPRCRLKVNPNQIGKSYIVKD